MKERQAIPFLQAIRVLLKPETVFLVLACSFGLGTLIANPPFQAPDENDHFARVFQLSEGTLIGEKRGNMSGGELPKAAIDVTNTEGIPFHYERKMSFSLFKRLSHPAFVEWSKAPRSYSNFPHTVPYPPAGYLPQALAVFLGRIFRIGPLGLMYLARLAGFTVSVALCYGALRQLPLYRWTTVLFLVCPMSLYLFGSVASDGIIIAGAIYVMAQLARIDVQPGLSIRPWELAITLVLAGLLALAKPVYLPFTGILMFVVIPKLGSARSRTLFAVAGLVICVLPVLVWIRLATALFVPANGGLAIDPSSQLRFVLHAPFQFLGLVGRTIHLQYVENFHWMVGVLGWGDTPMPRWFYPTFGYGLIACMILESNGATGISWLLRVVMTGAAAAIFILIYTAQYSTWNALGSSVPIGGIEGRYFLPLLPLVTLSFPPILPRTYPRLVAASAIILCVVSASVCLWAVMIRYYGAATAAENKARLTSFSTSALVGANENLIITGFSVSGTGLEKLLIRAEGTGLKRSGFSGNLEPPSIVVLDTGGKVVASNTGWGTNSHTAEVLSASADVGAHELAPNSAVSALVLRAPEGKYTVMVTGSHGSMGLVRENIYELSHDETRIENVSSRGYVGRGPDILVFGFVVGGKGTDKMLGRADGPSLSAFGVTGVLEKPTLEWSPLGQGSLINSGWSTSPAKESIAAATSSIGAFQLGAESADSAAVISLQPGAYTMKIYGANGGTGVALVELYEVP
jgi:uncharacterized membrane protein